MEAGAQAAGQAAGQAVSGDTNAALAWMRIRTANAHDMRATISELERFSGEEGELVHFLKAGDRISEAILSKEAAGWLEPGEVPSLKAALINRLSRRVLNLIQCDESSTWAVVKGRLKRAFGGARWAPEEDVVRLIRETKGPRQSAGRYAAKLLEGYATIAEKLGEAGSLEVARTKLLFLEEILRVQLKRETGLTLAADKTFSDLAQGLIDEDAKEAEENRWEREARWTEVRPRRAERRRPPPRESEWRPPRRERASRFEPKEEPARRNAPWGKRRPDGREEKRCFECGSNRHLAARCPKKACFECGSEGHLARNCPYLKRRPVDRGEPMEVNAQRVAKQEQQWTEVERSSEGSLDSDDESSSDRSSTSVARPWRKKLPAGKRGKSA